MAVNKVVFGNETVIDISDTTVTAEKMTAGAIAYDKSGAKIAGTMPDKGAVSGEILTKADTVTIAEGYHNGLGAVKIAAAEQNKILSENIKKGVTILGVAGKSTVVDTETAAGGISAAKVMDGYVGYVNGNKVTGTVADYSWGESVTGSPKALNYVSNEDGCATFRVANTGLYSNSQSATRLRFNLAEQGVVAENILSGKTVLGVEGKASGGGLPSGITAISSGTFTPSSNITSSYDIVHNLGITPNVYHIFVTDPINVEQFRPGLTMMTDYMLPITYPSNSYAGIACRNYVSSTGTSISYGVGPWQASAVNSHFTSTYIRINVTSTYPLAAGYTYRWIAMYVENLG